MTDTQQWPRTCEECGTELVAVQVAFDEADFSEGVTGTPVMQDVCPDPSCSRHDAELLASPGSLGGDNGGA